MITRWIRFYPESQEELNKEYQQASSFKGPSEKWIWFAQLIDYREMCSRNAKWTIKDRIRILLLWLVEKLT